MKQAPDPWSSGAPYEAFMGRWSRPVAAQFLHWLAPSPGSRWLDAGCGTGVLSGSILLHTAPAFITGLDFSARFVEYARKQYGGQHVTFCASDAGALPLENDSFDTAVCGLALNFFPHPLISVAEMARVTRPGGQVAAYVWDYAEGMQMLRLFWDTAVSLDPAAEELDEGRRFPLCRPQPLADLFERAGLPTVQTRAIEVPTRFTDFDDYWRPLLGGVGPVPGYIAGLTEDARAALKERLRELLPLAGDGSISLLARAWAVRGVA